MKIKEIVQALEVFAPLSLQESYDNSGLLIGNLDDEVRAALLCVDVTEEILAEATVLGCNLIIAHHPIIFSGVKKLNGNNYVERIIIKAIQHNIAIYACHTNADHVQHGVNEKIGEKLGITNARILLPKKGLLKKLVTFCPNSHAEQVRDALFEAGCGEIGNYDRCSFNTEGKGTFRPNQSANMFVGTRGKDHEEMETRIECIYESYKEKHVLTALRGAHPYEEIAHDLISLENSHPTIGSGMYGELNEPMKIEELFAQIKEVF